MSKHTASIVLPTGNDCWVFKLLRPEWVRNTWFLEDDVSALDAPERVPAGGCYRYEPIFHGDPFPMQMGAYRYE